MPNQGLLLVLISSYAGPGTLHSPSEGSQSGSNSTRDWEHSKPLTAALGGLGTVKTQTDNMICKGTGKINYNGKQLL